jgi:thiol-disulfide isomerase/thioredoxin
MALSLVYQNANAKVLTLGDPAPAITVKKFVKGTPVTQFEKGKLYVVEFWATWCGPCKESIPHLTQLQKKFKDVTFIGVSVWEQPQANVEPFVKTMGDKMDYHVAMDVVPLGKNGNAGIMATTWMAAAKQDGIPTAFIVGKDSKLAWIGHPMEMEEPLTKVVAGTWDLKAAAADAAHKQAMQAKLQDLNAQITPAMQKKDFAGALAILDKAIAASPDIEETVCEFKFSLLMNLGKDADATAYGGKLVDGVLHDNAQGLNAFAWGLVNPENPKPASPPLAELAVKAATRADELSKGTDAQITDTLATAYFAAGKKDLAVGTEERAIKNSTDAELTATLKKSLEKFKK